MDASTQAITLASAALPQVRLHPLVLLHVYNQYVRRKDTGNVTKVIGALLGYKTEQVSWCCLRGVDIVGVLAGILVVVVCGVEVAASFCSVLLLL